MKRPGIRVLRATKQRYSRRGVAAVWVSLLGVVLVSIVGLAMDAAVVYLSGSQLQIAADAASMAAARVVRSEDQWAEAEESAARAAARMIALENKALGTEVSLDLNGSNLEEGEIVIGRYHRFPDPFCEEPPCFYPQLEDPNAVRIRARRVEGSGDGQVKLVFGKAMVDIIDGVNVSRTATAMISGGRAAGLLVLHPSARCALELSTMSAVRVERSSGWEGELAIQVNSSNNEAVCQSAGEYIDLRVPEVHIVGKNPGYYGTLWTETYVNPDSPPMADPLADLDPPAIGPDRGTINSGGYYPPGYYSGGLNINGNNNNKNRDHDDDDGGSGNNEIRLGPGVYVFDGDGNEGGFQVRGGASVLADNVMIYVKGGQVNLQGDAGQIRITPMTGQNMNSDYAGIALFQARDNGETALIQGNGNMTFEGTYYYPGNRLVLEGAGMTVGNQIIARRFDAQGDDETYTIQYDGRFSSPSTKVFLVD